MLKVQIHVHCKWIGNYLQITKTGSPTVSSSFNKVGWITEEVYEPVILSINVADFVQKNIRGVVKLHKTPIYRCPIKRTTQNL